MTTGLLIVDVQNDFCEGGALAVAGGAKVAADISNLLGDPQYDRIIYTRDWHNPLPDTNDGHFDKWPVHCVRNTPGAEYHPDLEIAPRSFHIVKGDGRNDYSAFQGWNDDPEAGMSTLGLLRGWLKIDTLYVVGIAFEYCVKETAIDAAHLGFKTIVLSQFTAAINTHDAIAATVEMLDEGVVIQ